MKRFPLKKTSVFILTLFLSLDPHMAYSQTVIPPAGQAPAQQTVTLDFKDADINTVLRVMSLKSGVNIVAGPEVQGTVTIRLEDVPWQKALDVVLRTYGYVYEKDGNIIRVTTRENLAAEPVITRTFILNYSKANEIQTAVQDMLTERGRVKVAERMNMLVITDIPTNLYTIEEVVMTLDKVTPQAYIDSKVVKTDTGQVENLGIQWQDTISLTGSTRPTTFPFATGTNNNADRLGHELTQFFPIIGAEDSQNTSDARAFPFPEVDSSGGTFNFGTLDFSSFSAILQFLKTRANTKVVSNPRVVVLNNQTAKVQVGSDIPLPTFERNETTGSVEISGFSYREVGVVLNVTPHINSEEEILVDLTPEVSNQGTTIDFGDFQIPSFNVTKAETQVLIRSGETIAIGGLLTDNTQSTETKIPLLGDIPLVGKMFRSKRQTSGDSNKKVETLFFVTVTMVDTEGQPAGERRRDNSIARPADVATPQQPASSVTTETSSEEDIAKTETGTADSGTEPGPQSAG